ncbi:MAG: M20/M25/M40 family metallo-hydrolase, partial [Bacteroidales bacterium]|nr:M20/M25/M40 family metallo-hydrolase [Bacteroidales bacterium]
MKKVLVILFFISTLICRSQIPHLYDHTFPQITSQNYQILEMLEQVDENLIQNDVYHLSSYINRRADAIHIYNVKDWLVSQYENLDIDSINLHDFVVQSSWDTVPKPFTTAPNVLAFKRGTKYPNEYVVCGAHYDSYVITEGDFNPDTLVSPGADDNASGVAGILSAARILSNYSFERSIVFANWNAEEFGLCGSYQYAKQCRNDSLDIVAYFNLDMTGYLNPGDDIHIHLLYTQCDSLLGNFVKQICHTYFPNVNICQAWLPNGDTDYSSFNRNGYQAISPSEDVNHLSPYIHSTEDIIGMSVNSFEQAALFTKLNLACVAHAAGLI